jgi:aldehyde dehydrogenase (NAD+)
MHNKIKEFKLNLTVSVERLIGILSDYQPRNVTEYEIDRCLRTIDGLDNNDKYFSIGKKIDSMAVMLPSNLPLYSMFIFAIIPSLLSKEVNVRPNSILQEQDIISRIYDELGLENLFPHVQIINQDHAGFENCIKSADLVVFTGKPSSGPTFLKKMKKNSILAINGAGHNPLIVTDTANIDKAVEGALMLKGFNGGQDCAGPDAILVHHSVSQQFIEKFQRAFSDLKSGQFYEPDTIIGPIHRFSELQRLSGLIHNNSKDVIAGGTIDFKNSIVEPTVIVRGIERYPNYQEVYGPVTFIHPYKKDEDLFHYFEDGGQYAGNRMYVTVYGHSEYAMARNDAINPGASGNIGIVLHNETIHDVEIGYNAYGGYSMGASGLIKKSARGLQQVAMPILLPQVIVDYLIKNEDLPQFQADASVIGSLPAPSLKTGKQIEPIILDFQTVVKEIFKDEFAFAFVFGSAAKGKLKIREDDLDTFICVHEYKKEEIALYQKQIADLHCKYELKVDEAFPAEIMSLSALKEAIKFTNTLDVSIYEMIDGDIYDNLFWVHSLTDKKTGFMGDGMLMSSLIKQSQHNIFKWRNQIIEQIKTAETLPEHFVQTFSGLNKAQIVDKLEKLSSHLVVHLGLNYAEKEPQKMNNTLIQSQPGFRFFELEASNVPETIRKNHISPAME